MPIKDNKLDTDAKLSLHHKKALVEHRDHLIMTQWKAGFKQSEIAFCFNLRIKNINKIIKFYGERRN
jgi:hypothetical protein